MRLGWGLGVVVAVLLSVAVYLFYPTDPKYPVALMLLLVGLWTVASGFLTVEKKDRSYYMGWGVVIALVSLFAYLPANYSLGVILVAVVLMIIITVYLSKTEKVITAANNPPSPVGNTPAAAP